MFDVTSFLHEREESWLVVVNDCNFRLCILLREFFFSLRIVKDNHEITIRFPLLVIIYLYLNYRLHKSIEINYFIKWFKVLLKLCTIKDLFSADSNFGI